MVGIMPETIGCQLGAVMGRFITYMPVTDREMDAIKRRLFGFMGIMEEHAYTVAWIQEIDTADELHMALNELSGRELGEIFHY